MHHRLLTTAPSFLLLLLFTCLLPTNVLAAEEETEESQFATTEGALSTDEGDDSDESGDSLSYRTEAPTTGGSVGRSGTLTKQYPIDLLPARHGNQPPLGLLYSSGNRKNGPLGFGWSLPWVTITREGQYGPTPPHTYNGLGGFFGEPSSWTHDRYRLNVWESTHELLPLAGHGNTEGAFTTRYLQQLQWRIKASNGPFDHWTAQASNGYTYHFTSRITAGEATRNIQYVTEIRSADGKNNMYFSYMADKAYTVSGIDIGSRHVYPTGIEFGCAAPKTNCYRVAFEYETIDRPDIVLEVRHGELVAITRRLEKIKVLTPTQAIAWQYRIEYEPSTNGRSLLSRISRLTDKDDQLLPPVTYTYQEAAPPHTAWQEQATNLEPIAYDIAMNDGPTIDGGTLFTEMNHDGLIDQVQRFWLKGNAAWDRNCINMGDGSFDCEDAVVDSPFWLASLKGYSELKAKLVSKGSGMIIAEGSAEAITALYYDTPGTKIEWEAAKIKAYSSGAKFGDIDGDGALDIMQHGYPAGVNPSNNFLSSGIFDLDGTPHTSAPVVPESLPPLSGSLDAFASDPSIRVVDVNGDGFADIVKSSSLGIGNLDSHAWIFNPATTIYEPQPQWNLPAFFTWQGKKIAGTELVDLNSDGFVDIISVGDFYKAKTGGKVTKAQHDKQQASIDAYRDQTRGIFLNTGSGWLKATSQVEFDWSAWDGWFANGNDIPHTTIVDGQLMVELHYKANCPGAKHPYLCYKDAGWRFLDLNGDGLVDILSEQFKWVLLGRAGLGFAALPYEGFTLPGKDQGTMPGKMHTTDAALRFTDLNGDLQTDIVMSRATIEGTSVTGKQATWWRNPLTKRPDVLLKVTGPMGAKEYYTYKPYAMPGYTIGGSPQHVVTRIETWAKPEGMVTARLFGYSSPDLIYAAKPGETCPACADYDPTRRTEFLGFRVFSETTLGIEPTDLSSIDLFGHGDDNDVGATSSGESSFYVASERSRRRRIIQYLGGYARAGQIGTDQLETSDDHGQSWDAISHTSYSYYASDHPFTSFAPPYRMLREGATTSHYETLATLDTDAATAPTETETTTTTYDAYDPHGFLTQATFAGRAGAADDRTVAYTYTSSEAPWILGLVATAASTVNGQTITTANTYDDLGRLNTMTLTASDAAQSQVAKYTYDDVSNVTSVERTGNGALLNTTYRYDEDYDQFVISETTPLQHILTTTYYGINAQESLQYPSTFGRVARRYGRSTSAAPPAIYALYKYDAFGRPNTLRRLKTTNEPLTQGSAAWKATLLTDRSWQYVLHPDEGRSVTNIVDVVTLDESSRIQEITRDSLNRTLMGRRKAEGGYWRQVDYQYGPFGLLWKVSQPRKPEESPLWTTSTVDGLGRTTRVEYPGNRTMEYDYSAFARRTINSDGTQSDVETDGLGRITHVRDDGDTTITTYGDGIITVSASNNSTTAMQHNAYGWINERIDDDRGTWRWQYNDLGLPIQQIDGRGQKTAFQYDVVGRDIGIDIGADGSVDRHWYYDGETPVTTYKAATNLGRRTAMEDATGWTVWQYNARGLPSGVTRQLDGAYYKLGRSYDALGRLLKETHYSPSFFHPMPLFATRYTYDRDGLRQIHIEPSGHPTQSVLFDLLNDSAGRVTTIVYSNGTKEEMAYDAITSQLKNRVVRASSGDQEIFLSHSYDYHPKTGYITTIHNGLNKRYDQTFTYHPDGSLASVDTDDTFFGSRSFSADSAGNMEQIGDWNLHFTDADRPNRLSWAKNSATDQTFQFVYDGNGNVLKTSDRIFTYDPLNQLTRLSTSLGIIDYTYDGMGQRIKEVTSTFGTLPDLPPPPLAAQTTATSGAASKRNPASMASVRGAQADTLADEASHTERAFDPLDLKKRTTQTNRRKKESPRSPAVQTTPGPIMGDTTWKNPHAPQKIPTTQAFEESFEASFVANATTDQTVLNPFARLRVVTDAEGTTRRQYLIRAFGRHFATVTIEPSGEYALHYVHGNHVGSRHIVLDHEGAPVGGHTFYTPFGTPLDAEGNERWREWGASKELYVGVHLPEIAPLYATGPRFYDPSLGRFYQPDPIPHTIAGTNPYSYARNNPIMYLDPTGMTYIGISSGGEGGGGGSGGGGGGPVTLYSSSAPDGGRSEQGEQQISCAPPICTPQKVNPGRPPSVDMPAQAMVQTVQHTGHGSARNNTGDTPEIDIEQHFWDLILGRGSLPYFQHPYAADTTPEFDFWPEIWEDENASGHYRQNIEVTLDDAGQEISEELISHDLLIGAPRLFTLYHEFGHYMDFSSNAINRFGNFSTKVEGDIIADLYAAGVMEMKGLPYDDDDFYGTSIETIVHAREQCGGSLGNCGAFWKALEDGDRAFFGLGADAASEVPVYIFDENDNQ